ncbi:MAG: glycosyltransferase family 2 protein [Gemmatimonadaceae bacterium]
MTSVSETPLLSVILAIDTFERGRKVIESLSRQTIADRIELILVTTSPDDVRTAARSFADFHSIVIVSADSIVPLSVPRAIGVRTATAPYVFIAETHAYPDSDTAAKLVDLLTQGWSLVVPGFRNANPRNGISWSGFLSDYGAWSRVLPAGETQRAPAHDTAFRRSVLLDFSDRLEQALGFGDELYLGMRARGQRVWFDPTAGIQHVNLDSVRHWMRERYVAGVLVGGNRSSRWTWTRRLMYVCASPLIPFVVLSRVRRGVREVSRREHLPIGTIPALVAGTILKAAGEVRGYLLGSRQKHETGMTAFEVRKLAFNSGEEI